MIVRLSFIGPDCNTPLRMGVFEKVLGLVEFEPVFGHWLWVGPLTPDDKTKGENSGGYGRIIAPRLIRMIADQGFCEPELQAIFAHRYLYWARYGSIPRDHKGRSAVLDHDRFKCHGRVHNCCNPLHLTAVTSELNTARGNHARRHQHQVALLDPHHFEVGVL